MGFYVHICFETMCNSIHPILQNDNDIGLINNICRYQSKMSSAKKIYL